MMTRVHSSLVLSTYYLPGTVFDAREAVDNKTKPLLPRPEMPLRGAADAADAGSLHFCVPTRYEAWAKLPRDSSPLSSRQTCRVKFRCSSSFKGAEDMNAQKS